jgi:hypothetical protein
MPPFDAQLADTDSQLLSSRRSSGRHCSPSARNACARRRLCSHGLLREVGHPLDYVLALTRPLREASSAGMPLESGVRSNLLLCSAATSRGYTSSPPVLIVKSWKPPRNRRPRYLTTPFKDQRRGARPFNHMQARGRRRYHYPSDPAGSYVRGTRSPMRTRHGRARGGFVPSRNGVGVMPKIGP